MRFTNIIKTVDDWSVTQKVSGTSCSRRGRHWHKIADASAGYLTSWKYGDAPNTSVWSPRQAEISKDQDVGYS